MIGMSEIVVSFVDGVGGIEFLEGEELEQVVLGGLYFPGEDIEPVFLGGWGIEFESPILLFELVDSLLKLETLGALGGSNTMGV